MNVMVLKVSAGKATVIADNGEFITIPAKAGMKEGAAFEYTLQKKTWRRQAAIAASVLLCVLGFGALGTLTVSSYIDININPGVRLAVNQWGNVISAEAINEDGGVLINEINDSLLKDPAASVKQIIGQAWKDGTLKSSGRILLTISDNNIQRAQSTEMKLMVSALETVKEAGLSVDITLQKLDRESFESLRKEQGVLDDKSKSRVYDSSIWRSGKGGLYIEKAEYAGDGVIKIEISKKVSFIGNENVTVVDLNGVSYAAQLKESDGEILLIQCGGLKEDNIYKITVENIDDKGVTLSSFLYINALGKQNESQYIPNTAGAGENVGEKPDNENGETDSDDEDSDNSDEDEEDNGEHDSKEEDNNSGDNEDEDNNTDDGNTDSNTDEDSDSGDSDSGDEDDNEDKGSTDNSDDEDNESGDNGSGDED